jgi:hypothetical protein
MHVVRFAEAPEYTAPGHHDMAMVRLQGREAGPSSDLWVGVSVIAPGGGTMLSSSAQEEMYVVLNGTLVHLERRNQDRAQKMGFLPHWQETRPPPDQLNNSPVIVLLAMPLSAEERQRGQ